MVCCEIKMDPLKLYRFLVLLAALTVCYLELQKDGLKINWYDLLSQYCQICPINRYCEHGNYSKMLYNMTTINVSAVYDNGCPSTCMCTPDCYIYDTCCPDNPNGYLGIEIVHEQVWPTEKIFTDPLSSYHRIVTICPYDDEQDELVQKCVLNDTFSLKPVLSKDTDLLYRNEHCAACHSDYNNVELELYIQCAEAERFDKLDAGLLATNTCRVNFEHLSCNCFPNVDRKHNLINRCNMTGLWTTYNPDIDWACRRLQQSYLHFQNIFCYICNPSISNVRHRTALIGPENCSNNTAASIKSLCETTNTSSRLSPYKNIYCRICNDSSYIGKKNTFKYGSYEVVEHLSGTNILYLNFNDESVQANINNLKTYVYQLKTLFCPPHCQDEISLPSHIKKKAPFSIQQSMFQSLIEGIAGVCGEKYICDKGYIHFYSSGIYSQCANCSCGVNCVFQQNVKCCFDKLIKIDPYECVNRLRFPVVNTGKTEFSDTDPKVFKLVNKCVNDYTDEELRRKCEDPDSSDLLFYIPVKTHNSRSFRNIYCLQCNTVASEIHIFLNITCDTWLETDLLLSLDEILLIVKENNCHVSFTANDQSKTCIKQQLKAIEWPQQAVSKCNESENWKMSNNLKTLAKDRTVKKLCEENLLYPEIETEMHPVLLDQTLFKNPFCILCNGPYKNGTNTYIDHCTNVRASQLERDRCYKDPVYNWWYPYKNLACYNCKKRSAEDFYFKIGSLPDFGTPRSNFDTMFYRQLFSISRDNVIVLHNEKCTGGTFDSKTGNCQNLYCPDGMVLNDGACRYDKNTIINTAYIINIAMITEKLDVHEENNLTESHYSDDGQTITSFLFLNTIELYDLVRDTVVNKTQTFTRTSLRMIECNITMSKCVGLNGNTLSDWDPYLFCHGDADIHISIIVLVSHSIHRIELETSFAEIIQNVYYLGNIQFSPTTIPTNFNKSTDCTKVFNIMNMNGESYTIDQTIYFNTRLICAMVELGQSDFNITNDGSTVHLYNDVNVPKSEVVEINDNGSQRIRVCEVHLKPNELQLEYSFIASDVIESDIRSAFFIVSNTCTAMSLISLLLTMLTYLLFKVLRTVPGKNNLHLALCLFIAQSSLQYSNTIAKESFGSLTCKITGTVIHYFWLATFCAMNVCSFHMFRVFYAARMISLRENIHARNTRYVIYTYSLPLLIVASIICINVAVGNDTSIGYGTELCFLDSLNFIVFGFLVPSGLIFMSNFVFYVLTFYKILRAPTLNTNYEDRRYLKIYARLCTITGISWPLVFIDALFELSVFSFIVTVINGLQGFFIFLAFICNRRVCKLNKALVYKSDHTSTSSGMIDSYVTKTRRTIQ